MEDPTDGAEIEQKAGETRRAGQYHNVYDTEELTITPMES